MKKSIRWIAIPMALSALITTAGCGPKTPLDPMQTDPLLPESSNGTTSELESESTAPDSPDLPGIQWCWNFDSIDESGNLSEASGAATAAARSCSVADNAISGKSLLLMPSKGSSVRFGTALTDLFRQHGSISIALWYYRIAPGQKSVLLNLRMEDGKSGFRIDLEDSTITVSVRSDCDDIVHSKTFDCTSAWGIWQHLAVSVDCRNGMVRLWWNGAEKKPHRGDSTVDFHSAGYRPGTVTSEDYLGGDADAHFEQTGFSGYLDELYVFFGAIDQADLKGIYQSGAGSNSLSALEKGMMNMLRTLTKSGSVVAACGKNTVLRDGKRVFLVPGDSSVLVKAENGEYDVPVSFFEMHLGAKPTEAQQQAVGVYRKDGTVYCSARRMCEVLNISYRGTDSGILLFGENTDAFSQELLSFLRSYFFEGGYPFPETEEDFSSTRRTVAYSNYNKTKISLGSPSVARFSNGVWIVSYDYNGTNYHPVSTGTNDSGIAISADNGKTWNEVAIVPRMMWSTLFVLEDTAYLVGRDTGTGKLAIVKSTDYGKSWTSAKDGMIDSTVGSLHHAPTPAVISNGRIYLAFEDSCNDFGEAKWTYTKRAYVMSASMDADLLDAKSWKKSNYVSFDAGWMDPDAYYTKQMGFLEGNAVAGRDGTVRVFLRVESDPTYGKVCVLKLSPDNSTLSFERIGNLPVGKDKFVIRYDEQSGHYIAIGNIKTTELCPTQRNVVAMYYSEDLDTWTYGATLLVDNSLLCLEESMRNHGMQYPDFLFDGEDLCMVLREASDEATYYHNANYITWYRIKCFRNYLSG